MITYKSVRLLQTVLDGLRNAPVTSFGIVIFPDRLPLRANVEASLRRAYANSLLQHFVGPSTPEGFRHFAKSICFQSLIGNGVRAPAEKPGIC
jgi:hypothetical protein